MDLSINSNLSFKSRSAAIRKADDFARKVKGTVPLLSSTKMYRLKSHKNRPWATGNLEADILYVRHCLRERCFYTGDISGSGILEPILEYKTGNCFESTSNAERLWLAWLDADDLSDVRIYRICGIYQLPGQCSFQLCWRNDRNHIHHDGRLTS